MRKKGFFCAHNRGVCAYYLTFLPKKFAYMKKKVFLCTRIFNKELIYKQFKSYNYVRN